MTFHDARHRYLHPARWYDTAPHNEGSWWPAWQKWLVEHSSEKVEPPAIGAPENGIFAIGDAPGTYVHRA
jgi:polyhydroxyalkanoate synthase subunit PhaC